jgi:hypothetical protein
MGAGIADHDPWGRLRLVAGPNRGEFRALESDAAVSAGRVLYALDAEGCRHLLIPSIGTAAVAADQRSAGVHLVPHQLVENDRVFVFIDVACRKLRLNDIFSYLADEIVSGLRVDASDPYRTCRRVLARWREFIDRQLTSVLSPEALAGLFGELWHLRELVRREAGAVDAWVGPLGQPYDFLSRAAALEVKTTLSREAWLFEIHGIEQLDPPAGGALHLAVMRLELSQAGESVPAILDDLSQLGVDAHELFGKLAKIGYDARDTEHYRRQLFRVRDNLIYVVDDDFPRLVRASFLNAALPARVSRLSYYIDLAGRPPNPLEVSVIERLYNILAEADM